MAQTSFHVCYHCKDRTIGCHAKCEVYQKERREREQLYAQRLEEKKLNDTLYDSKHRRTKSLKQGK